MGRRAGGALDVVGQKRDILLGERHRRARLQIVAHQHRVVVGTDQPRSSRAGSDIW